MEVLNATDPIASALFGIGLIAAAVWSGWQSVNAKRQAVKAAEAAHPVSNGWGTAVRADLSRAVDALERLERRADVQDRRQTAADERETARDQAILRLSSTLATHLAEHDRGDAA